MTVTLKDLSDNERQIYDEADYQQRYTGGKPVDTSNEWLYKAYSDVHNEYLNIHEHSLDQNIKMEALKRLIFLNWYYKVEPDYYTGIIKLNEKTIVESYKILNNYIRENKLDLEFNWMLSFYSSWEYIVFEYSENKLNALTDFVNNVDTSISLRPLKDVYEESMKDRGQMGIYWNSLDK